MAAEESGENSISFRSAFGWILALIWFCGGILRFLQLDLRPLHSDEGGNYWFIKEVLTRGIYPYSHENYHGPLFFYAAAVPVVCFGYSAISIRVFAAFCGTLLPAVPLLLLKDLGRRTVLAAAALLAVSPSLVFYSRYSIHEIPFVLAGLTFAAFLYRWIAAGERKFLYLAAISAVIIVALKETFVFTGVGALIAAGLSFGPAALIDLVKRQRREIGISFFCATIGTIFIFTGGGRWTKGIIELLSALPQWFGRGTTEDVGHFKPWYYYILNLFAAVEPAVLPGLAASLLVIVWYFIRHPGPGQAVVPNSKIEFFRCWRYLLIFSLFQFFIYSAIPYKTPWLAVNLSAPGLIAVACLFGWVTDSFPVLGRAVALFLFVPILGYSGFETIGYCFRPGEPWARMGYVPYGEQNPFSYVHTADGMLEMVDVISSYKSRHPDAKILIAVSGYWPLPFYLRRYDPDSSYLVTTDLASQVKENSIIVGDGDTSWRDSNYTDQFFKLSDFQTARLFLRKDQQP